jgi:hypothetical protein
MGDFRNGLFSLLVAGLIANAACVVESRPPPAPPPPPPAPPPAAASPAPAPPPAAPPAVAPPAAAGPATDSATPTTTSTPSSPGWRWEVDSADALKFEVPNKWERSTEGRFFTTRAPDRSVAMKFDAVSTGAKDTQHDEKKLLGYVKHHLTNASIDGPVRDVAHHGFTGVVFEGHGFESGAKVRWVSEMLSDGKGHRLLILAIATPEGFDKHRATVQRIFDSIQPG